MPPTLLLDVDGVLCPFPDEPPEGATQFYRPDFDGELWVWICPGMKERLARLSETFEFVWATAWVELANEFLLEPFEIQGPLPTIDFARHRPGGIALNACWKLPWIEDWASEGQVFAWIDDDIDKGTIEWAEKRSADGIPTLALPINYATGLTDHHVEKLEEWAAQLDN